VGISNSVRQLVRAWAWRARFVKAVRTAWGVSVWCRMLEAVRETGWLRIRASSLVRGSW
jgi:hypothetical protein